MRDIYPNLGLIETSTLATPSVDDREALNEDTSVAEKASENEASKKRIFLVIGIFILMVVFLGVGG